MPLEQNFIATLKKHRCRSSQTRTKILETLEIRHCCSAADLLAHLSKVGKQPHKTTIYRELDKLLLCGVIQELDFGDGQKKYELAHQDHHHHLVCTGCGQAQPFSFEENLDSLAKPKAAKAGFRLAGHALEFFGLCKTCQG